MVARGTVSLRARSVASGSPVPASATPADGSRRVGHDINISAQHSTQHSTQARVDAADSSFALVTSSTTCSAPPAPTASRAPPPQHAALAYEAAFSLDDTGFMIELFQLEPVIYEATWRAASIITRSIETPERRIARAALLGRHFIAFRAAARSLQHAQSTQSADAPHLAAKRIVAFTQRLLARGKAGFASLATFLDAATVIQRHTRGHLVHGARALVAVSFVQYVGARLRCGARRLCARCRWPA
jgi:hypothetical protein